MGKRRVLVAGAGGFIGGHLVNRLTEQDKHVTAVDIKPMSEWFQTNSNSNRIPMMDLSKTKNADLITSHQYNDIYMLACFDDQTEIWTKDGWKQFAYLDEKDQVATLSKDGFLEWQKPIEHIAYHYDGPLYSFDSQTVDLKVTPNHNVYVRRSHKDTFELRKAEDTVLKQVRMKRGLKWNGDNISEFDINIDADAYHHNTKKLSKFPIIAFLRFLGYYLAEGSCNFNVAKGTYRIHLSNTSPTILSDMKRCVAGMGFTPYFDHSTSHGISFQSKMLCDYLRQFGTAGQKFIPADVKELSPALLKHLHETMMHGDGSKNRGTYYTTSKELADDFGELCLKLGYSYTISHRTHDEENWNDRYDVYFCDKDETVLHEYPTTVEYSGNVYCVEVPNHIIYVRRNGKPIWCGNCNMGGMGYIASHKTECMLSVLISAGMIRGAINSDAERYLYSSSACVYSSYSQQDTNVSLKESDAYPADPEPGYGLEKLFSEELTINVGKETNLETRAPRFHNVYGPYGSYDGGREKAPAAICRKVIQAKLSKDMNISIWGDGEQTRSFMYIDDCIDGILKLMDSDIREPINLGSAQLVTINELVSIAEDIAGVKLKRSYELDKPQGVRGRCSDNTKIKEELGWEPSISLGDGMEKTYKWIYDCIVNND